MATPATQGEIWEELTRSPQACLAVDAAGQPLVDRLPDLLAANAPTRVEAGPGTQLLRFDAVSSAAQAALRLRQDHPDTPLRLGLSLCDATEGSWSEARSQALALAQQAAPGEVLASESACDQLVAGLDAEIHAALQHPGLPAYSLAPAVAPQPDWQQTMPVLMLLPLRVAAGNGCDPLYAELLYYGVQRALSQNKAWRLISRQSSEALRHRSASAAVARSHCRASHVTTGTVSLNGRALTLDMHVVDTHSGAEAWRGRISHPVALARWTENPYGRDVLRGLSDALMGQPCDAPGPAGLPEVQSYRLLFSAMTLMHRRSLQDFERSLRLLQALIERHPQASEPQAWLAKWHVMRVARRLSPSVADDRQAALAAAALALDRSGDRALALAIDGHVRAYLSRDFDAAEAQLQAALVENPSESLAWLYLSAVQVYQGRSREAADAARMAQLLSPLDPMRYYYDSFAAHALLAAEQLAPATVLAQRSVSAYPAHVPTLVTLAIARALQEQDGLGRQVIEQLRRVDPGYCIAGFHVVYPGAAAPYGQRWAAALRRLGLPEQV